MNTIIKSPNNFKATLFIMENNKKDAKVLKRKAESNSFVFRVFTMPGYVSTPKKPTKMLANRLLKNGRFTVLKKEYKIMIYKKKIISIIEIIFISFLVLSSIVIIIIENLLCL